MRVFASCEGKDFVVTLQHSIQTMNSFVGYHGTDNANVDSILTGGMDPSLGDDEWLGDGTYFFIEGLSRTPEVQAEQWAIVSAWDSELRKNKYDKYSVLKADIDVDDEYFLDLTTAEGLEVFYYIKETLKRRLKRRSKPNRICFIDGIVINMSRNELSHRIDAVKGNVFIKLTKEDRIYRLQSRLPNCTIAAVFNQDCISNVSNAKTGTV